MKTLIVLCSLVTITIAVPSLPRGNFETVIQDVPERIIREKKSPHDALQEAAANEAMEILQNRNSQKTESSLDKTKPGFRKPIIIKKKLGYHVYRDSDEEMAHADPNENCRKQFKVKICDNEPSMHSHSANVKSLSLERPHENISDKEMESSIKMARDAVDKLQKDLLKMEQNTGKLGTSKEHLESDMALQQDIEMAKNALEHIQKNIGNIESIDFPLNDLKKEESQVPKSSDAEAIREWKESIGNIYKNDEIPRNIEDAFKFEKQSESTMLDDQQKDQSSTQSMKAVNEDNNKNINLKSKDEQNTNAENDMFVSITDNKESKMKLHSESLTSDNVFDKNLAGHDIKPIGFNTNDHLSTAKQSELNFETEKKIHNLEEKVVSGADMSSWQNNDGKNLKPAVPLENNIFDTLTGNRDISSSILTAKNTENSEGDTLKHSHIEISKDEHHKHKSTVKTNEDLHLAGKSLSSEQKRDSLKSEGDLTEAKRSMSESLDVSGTEQRNVEHLKPELFDKDNTYSSDVKLTSMKSAEMKDPHSRNVLNINSSTQKNKDNLDNKFVNEADLTGTLISRAHQEQLDNVQKSLPYIPVGNHKAEHKSSDFSRMRMDQLLNENHESQDFHLMHSTQEGEPMDQLLHASKSVSHFQNAQLQNTNTQEHLNVHNNLNVPHFMNAAEENHFNENIPHHLKTISESNNEYTNIPSTKTNEFRNQHIMNEYMNARMHQIHNMEQLLRENHRLDDFNSMPSASRNHHMDHSSQQFKSETEFHNDHLLPTFTKTNGLKDELNRHPSMRLTESSDKGHELSDSQHLNDPFMLRWAQEKQHKDLQEFKGSSEFNNEHKFPTMMKTKMFHTGQHKEPMHMRITEDSNLGQAFTDSHELHDSHLMHWAQGKQHNENLAQTFDDAAELHNEHLHEHIPTNRFSDNLDSDSSHNIFPMRTRMHEHLHMMKHAKPYDMDSSMQPSMHISMRDSDIPLGHHHHHHHHGLARSSYSPSLPIANSSPGAVGVFSEANTGCGIPLLLSCSPSVVSGSLAKAHPTGMSAPAYRAGDDFMYYMKRDANHIEGLNNVSVHKPSKTFNQ